MIKKLIPALLLFFIFYTNARAADEKMRVAVMDLKGNDVSLATAKGVSDLVRTALFNTGYFRIVERSEMDSILKEQGFQLSGCTETECAVQVGKLLSARKMLVGTISKIGKSYIINARIVDVERGEMEFGDNAKADSEDNLDAAVNEFAKKLADRIKVQKLSEQKSPLLREISYVLIGAGAVSGVLAIVYDNKMNNAYNDYFAINDPNTSLTEWNSKWNTAVSAKNNRNLFRGIAYGAGGLGVVLFGIDLLFNKSSNKTTSTTMNNNDGFHVAYNNGYKVSYDFRW